MDKPNARELLKEARDWIGDAIISHKGMQIERKTLLRRIDAALSTTEKDNADWQEYNAELLARAERAEAYAVKLEKAGDGMREALETALHSMRLPETEAEEIDAWDSARKEKP